MYSFFTFKIFFNSFKMTLWYSLCKKSKNNKFSFNNEKALWRRGAMVYWLRQKTHVREVKGSSPVRHHVDCFTQHYPPVTLDCVTQTMGLKGKKRVWRMICLTWIFLVNLFHSLELCWEVVAKVMPGQWNSEWEHEKFLKKIKILIRNTFDK